MKKDWSEVKWLMRKTWEEIAPDVLGGEGGGCLYRAEVIDIVLDRMYYTDKLPHDLMMEYMNLSLAQRKRMAEEEFKEKYYGW